MVVTLPGLPRCECQGFVVSPDGMLRRRAGAVQPPRVALAFRATRVFIFCGWRQIEDCQVMSLTLHTPPGNFRAFKALIAAEYCGENVKIPAFKEEDAKANHEFQKL